MSRAYKDSLVDEVVDLGGTGLTAVTAEAMSGADLEQARLVALNGKSVAIAAATGGAVGSTKTLGVNAYYAGSPNCAALSGADLEIGGGAQ